MKFFDFKNLSEKQLNDLPLREAMGLPRYFTSSFLEKIGVTIGKLRNLSKHQLINILKDKKSSLIKRLAAGQILAHITDPRIKVFNPKMIYIPSGRLLMGTSLDKIDLLEKEFCHLGVKREWLEKEFPPHEVEVKAFYLALYPITNSEYKDFLSETQSEFLPTSWDFGQYPIERSNHPVYSVPTHGVFQYIDWLNKKTSRNYRLPTEAEWEYAAKGTSQNEYPWGELESRYDYNELTNTLESGIFRTTSVGTYPLGASEFGILDMGGNVEEYTQSTYNPYPNGPLIKDDLFQKNSEHYFVTRGGSFARFRDLARCARRHGAFPSPLYAVGFRLAENVD